MYEYLNLCFQHYFLSAWSHVVYGQTGISGLRLVPSYGTSFHRILPVTLGLQTASQ